jgi:hypothetical protein
MHLRTATLTSPTLAAANPESWVEVFPPGAVPPRPLDPAHLDRSIGYLTTQRDRYPQVGYDRPKASDHALASR